MKRIWTRSLAIAIVCLTLASLARPQMVGYTAEHHTPAEQVSLLQLIASPERYDGKVVAGIGFLDLEFEGNAIYLHREDFDLGESRNALWVDVPREMAVMQQRTVSGLYVICVGRFRASNHGHMGMFSGAVTEIERLQIWPAEARLHHPQSSGVKKP